MKKIASLFSAFMLCLTLTACGSSEPATAPSVTESEKSIVQEKLNKNKNSSETTNETKEIATPQIGTTKETDAISKKETADTTQESSSATTATSLKQNEPESNADKGNETSKQDEQKTEATTAVTEPQPTEPTVDKTNILVAYLLSVAAVFSTVPKQLQQVRSMTVIRGILSPTRSRQRQLCLSWISSHLQQQVASMTAAALSRAQKQMTR